MKFMVVVAACALCALAVRAEESVRLQTTDGKSVEGLLYGKGEVGLVLCHGRAYKTGGASYRDQSAYLEKEGIMCLALSFRGYPSESPPPPVGGENDIVAAIAHLSSRGAKRVYVLGSSMGGFIALSALTKLEAAPGFAGIIAVSAFHPTALAKSESPKLFIVAEDDSRYFSKARTCFEGAAKPKRMIGLKTGGHGQMLFVKHGNELLDKIVAFMRNR